MATYTVKFQNIINGKPSGSITTAVTANSEHEAREKFKMNHSPDRYKIVAVVKR
jgi:hypothetical protein